MNPTDFKNRVLSERIGDILSVALDYTVHETFISSLQMEDEPENIQISWQTNSAFMAGSDEVGDLEEIIDPSALLMDITKLRIELHAKGQTYHLKPLASDMFRIMWGDREIHLLREMPLMWTDYDSNYKSQIINGRLQWLNRNVQ